MYIDDIPLIHERECSVDVQQIYDRVLEAQAMELSDFSFIDDQGKRVEIHLLDHRDEWCETDLL